MFHIIANNTKWIFIVKDVILGNDKVHSKKGLGIIALLNGGWNWFFVVVVVYLFVCWLYAQDLKRLLYYCKKQ